MTKKALSRVGLAASLMALFCVVLPADLYAAPADGLVGSWIVTIRPDGGGKVSNLASIATDGTLTNSDPNFGGGVGTWEKVGGREYAVKFVHLVSSPIGVPPGTKMLVVRGLVKTKSSGARAVGPFVTSFVNSAGDELASFAGSFRLDRISLD